VSEKRHESAVSPFLAFDQLVAVEPSGAVAFNGLHHQPGPIDATLHRREDI